MRNSDLSINSVVGSCIPCFQLKGMFLAKLDTDSSSILLLLRFSMDGFLMNIFQHSLRHLEGSQSLRKARLVKPDMLLTQWISNCAVSRIIRATIIQFVAQCHTQGLWRNVQENRLRKKLQWGNSRVQRRAFRRIGTDSHIFPILLLEPGCSAKYSVQVSILGEGLAVLPSHKESVRTSLVGSRKINRLLGTV